MLMAGRQQAGVTLVELIVTLSVVAILAAMAVPSFKGMILNRQISASAESNLNALQLARAEAVRRNAQVSFVLNADSTWTVGCVTVTASCPATIQGSTIGDGANSAVTITSTPAGGNVVAFNSFGTVVPVVSTLTQLDFTLPVAVLPASQAHPLRVEIGAGGSARLCDPAYSAPDARAC